MQDVPHRRSIESLKKEAKRWLAALREHNPDARTRLVRAVPSAPESPTLRDVQHALAVEQGFAGWTELQLHEMMLNSVAGETLATYDVKAAALLDAYRTGTPEAMERHWSLTWHRRAWSGMRSYVRADLGKPDRDDIDITIDDARWLVAREHGFEDWSALKKAIGNAREPELLAKRPMAMLAKLSKPESHEAGEPVFVSRSWREIVEELGERDVTGLSAHGQMTDALVRDIVGMSQLTTLRLSGSQGLTDEGVKLLASMTQLEHLDLSSTAVTDVGLAALRSLTSLRHLNVSWTRVSDSGVTAFERCQELEYVDINGTYCGDGAIRTFADKPKLGTFACSRVSDDALALFHRYPVFKSWQGGDIEMGLTSYDPEPNRLFLRGPFTDRGIGLLKGLNGLFALNLDDSALNITGRALAPLIDLEHLGWLAFDARDDAMPILAQMPHLRFLGCQDTTASDAGWEALGASKSIEKIWGRRCYGLSNRGFLALSKMPKLTSLSVSCKNVDDASIAALPAFPSLRELMPMDIPDAGYRHIGRCDELTSLVLMYCRDTSDAATENITSMPKLAKYFASYTQITDRTPEFLCGVQSLEAITFDSCAGLTNDGIAKLARLPKLKELRVSGQQLTRAVTAHFGGGVRVYYSL